MNDAGRIGFVIKGDYSNTETYDFLDIAYFNGATYVAKKLTVGNTPDNTEFWHILADGSIDVNDVAPTFLQAETRENINSGEKLPVLFGKIKKWYTDLKAVAFSGSYNDLSDTPSIPAAVAVKGNAESSYRTGNVNLTPANIGAMPTANVLDSKESITANTASGNVAGALGTKEINANLQSQIDTLNSSLDNHLNRNCQTNFYRPSNTNYETLLELLINEIFGKSNQSFCIFGAENFSDLPQANWGFTIIAFYTNGALHVYAYKFLSNNTIYVRGCDFSANWVDDWKLISFAN